VEDEGIDGIQGLTNELRIVFLPNEESQDRFEEFYFKKVVR
jgi:hypothetical protein